MTKRDLRDIMNAREETFVQSCLLVKSYLESVFAPLNDQSIEMWYEDNLNMPPRCEAFESDDPVLSKLYNDRASMKLPPSQPKSYPQLDTEDQEISEERARFVINMSESNTIYYLHIYDGKATISKFGDKVKRDLKIESGLFKMDVDWVETVVQDRLKSTELNLHGETSENAAANILLALEKFSDDELCLFLRAHRKGFGVSDNHVHRKPEI